MIYLCDTVNTSLTLAILRYEGAPEVEPTTFNVPGPKLDDSLMHVGLPWLPLPCDMVLITCGQPIASEGPGKLVSGPPDFAKVLTITQPNAPFFDINEIVSVLYRGSRRR